MPLVTTCGFPDFTEKVIIPRYFGGHTVYPSGEVPDGAALTKYGVEVGECDRFIRSCPAGHRGMTLRDDHPGRRYEGAEGGYVWRS